MIYFLYVLTWFACGYLAMSFWVGWLYYYLYPRYWTIGTPDEQLKDDLHAGDEMITFLFSVLLGPLALVSIIITYAVTERTFKIKPKFKFW